MERLLFWCFTLVVCLAPLPFGGNQPWAWSLLALLLGLVALLWGMAALAARDLVTLRSRRSLPYAAGFLLLAAWFLLQALPLTPAAWHHPAWAATAAALERPLAGAVALVPDRAVTALMRLATYAAAFWLGLHLLRRRQQARLFAWALVVAGVAYAAYGLVAYLDGSRMVLWLRKFAYNESLTATFINRNSYAAYAGLGLVLSLGLLLDQLTRSPAGAGEGWRARLVAAFDALGFGTWFLFAALATLATALLLTGSRGGLAATALGCLTLVLLFARRRRLGFFVGLGALALLVLLVAGQSGELLLRRLGDLAREGAEGAPGDRLPLYALTLEAIARHPWAGTGLGSFAGVYLESRGPASGLSPLSHVRAHNSFLELTLEAGLPAALLLFGGLGVICWRLVRALGEDGVARRYPAIVLAATLLLGAHSLIDFPLQMPGIAVTYFALLGLGLAQSYPHRRPTSA